MSHPKGNFFFQQRLAVSAFKHAIRVLVLLPGKREAQLTATARLLNLDDSGREPYTALSYTWGDAHFPETISVDEEIIPITTNLHDALCHIRREDQPVTIWVDAVCINQEGVVERSSQVAFMDEIYLSCEAVYIWLGVGDNATPTGTPGSERDHFALVRHFRDDKHFFELPGYRRDFETGLWVFDAEIPGAGVSWMDFEPISTSAWWTRAWTVQETILPTRAVLMYGQSTLTWNDLAEFTFNRARHINNYSGECCGRAHEALGGKRMQAMDNLTGHVMRLEHLRRRTGYIRSFSDVSRAFADRQCKDPRDKIYSILSFAKPGKDRLGIRPDYQKAVRDVYVEAFCLMLQDADMSPSCLLGEGFNSTSFGLPSWVRDFSKAMETGDLLRRAFEAYPLYNASARRLAKVKLTSHGELQLRGTQVDVIKDRSRVAGHHVKASFRPGLLDDWLQVCMRNGITVTHDTVDKTFVQVLCRGVIDDREAGKGKWRLLDANDSELPCDTQWKAFIGGDSRVVSRKYRIGVATGISGQVLYVTWNGRLGLGDPQVEIGDVVWIVEGSNVPFILRKTTEPDHYRLIGDTYLHGVMCGECVNDIVDTVTISII
ncbi:uncharacterized protein E0L32_007536 [Thyridium curvatum]|uniref:Heterokaryon incompatibility domain-containing protein n=1 Tax=Thyridium curvatum TaxID=1093900 RepID=A0A507B3B9_9PEZI|nr:uncharacterized protein E0L32_007536 [Thyridium curvatum]TPX11799.1 hypothetical protein E0L32_007536 [Thyridium curvatum]